MAKAKGVLKNNIETILHEYISEHAQCEECCNRIMEEIEAEDIIQIVGDAELTMAIKNQYNTHALAVIVNTPEPDTLEFRAASHANLREIETLIKKEEKLLALKNWIEDKIGRELTTEELEQGFAPFQILNT